MSNFPFKKLISFIVMLVFLFSNVTFADNSKTLRPAMMAGIKDGKSSIKEGTIKHGSFIKRPKTKIAIISILVVLTMGIWKYDNVIKFFHPVRSQVASEVQKSTPQVPQKAPHLEIEEDKDASELACNVYNSNGKKCIEFTSKKGLFMYNRVLKIRISPLFGSEQTLESQLGKVTHVSLEIDGALKGEKRTLIVPIVIGKDIGEPHVCIISIPYKLILSKIYSGRIRRITVSFVSGNLSKSKVNSPESESKTVVKKQDYVFLDPLGLEVSSIEALEYGTISKETGSKISDTKDRGKRIEFPHYLGTVVDNSKIIIGIKTIEGQSLVSQLGPVKNVSIEINSPFGETCTLERPINITDNSDGYISISGNDPLLKIPSGFIKEIRISFVLPDGEVYHSKRKLLDRDLLYGKWYERWNTPSGGIVYIRDIQVKENSPSPHINSNSGNVQDSL